MGASHTFRSRSWAKALSRGMVRGFKSLIRASAQHPLYLTALSYAEFGVGFVIVGRLGVNCSLHNRAAGELDR
jgi:hypothetical protein